MNAQAGPGAGRQASRKGKAAGRRVPPVTKKGDPSALVEADLISDRALAAADTDLLGHSALAGRIADIASKSETPLAIALFGPWGSGKSSLFELVRRSLPETPPRKLIGFDAWAFSGEPLQRAFISHAARELGFTDDQTGREYFSGLYESRRSAVVDLSRLDRKQLGVAIVFVTALFSAVGAVVALLYFVLTGNSALDAVLPAIPGWIVSGAIFGSIAGVLKQTIDHARIDVDQSPPSQELFRQRFEKLVGHAHVDLGYDRLIFFIDELDRCSKENVVEVLSTVRSFFEIPNCVFIIAADRQVLSEALERLPQSTPPNVSQPYYSSASAFLDKIFQHQVSIPPIRLRRLDRLARELIDGRPRPGSVWVVLQDGLAGLPTLDDVLYALLPSHLSSPRRVKVLLNNFATHARVAQSRGFNWRERAPELAKLTVLETEFPALAADLPREPRLPLLLLEPDPKTDSYALANLLTLHRLPRPDGTMPPAVEVTTPGAGAPAAATPGTAEADAAPAAPTDAILATKKRPELAQAQRVDLRNYLLRTQSVPGPRRDLLYLEPAGAAVDLTDVALGEWIEDTAVNAPGDVLTRLAGVDAAEREKSIRVLADMAGNYEGNERANILVATFGAAVSLDPGYGHAAQPLRAVLASLDPREIATGAIPDVVSVAVRLGYDVLAKRLLSDPRTFSTIDGSKRVLALADRLEKPDRITVANAIAPLISDNHDLLIDAVSTLGTDALGDVMWAASIVTAVGDELAELHDTPDDAKEFAEQLMTAAVGHENGRIGLAALRMLVQPTATEVSYQVATDYRDTVLAKRGPAPVIARIVLVAASLEHAAPGDWAGWVDWLSKAGEPQPSDAQIAVSMLATIFGRHDEPGAPEALAAAASPVVPFAKGARNPAGITTAIAAAIAERSFWLSTELRQEHLGVLTAALTIRDGGLLVSEIDQLVDADLSRVDGLRTITLDGLITIQEIAERLPDQVAATQSARILGLSITDNGLALQRTRARLALATRQAAAGVTASPVAVALDEIEAFVLAGGADGREIGSVWYRLRPSFADGLALANQLGPAMDAPLRSAVLDWGRSLSTAERTQLTTAVAGTSPANASDWVRDARLQSLDEAQVVQLWGRALQGAARGEERRVWARLIERLGPTDPHAREEVSELIKWCFEQNKAVDAELGIELLPIASDERSSRRSIKTAIRASLEAGLKLDAKQRAQIERAGVSLPKRKWFK